MDVALIVYSDRFKENPLRERKMSELYFSKVKSIRRIKQKSVVYNFSVPKYETYIANGIGVHNCQNFEISQVGNAKHQKKSPTDIVEMALDSGADGIAFTYSEPFVWYEYVMDVAAEARTAGLKTILKTNGYAEEKAFSRMLEAMDAVNIDVKGSAKLYKEVAGIELSSDPNEWIIMRNLRKAWRTCHCEISSIAIPPYCDDHESNIELFTAIKAATGPQLPVHLLRFIPDFKLINTPPTSHSQLDRLAGLARTMFDYVYVEYAGMPTNTKCECGQVLVERKGIEMISNVLIRGKICPKCGRTHNFEI